MDLIRYKFRPQVECEMRCAQSQDLRAHPHQFAGPKPAVLVLRSHNSEFANLAAAIKKQTRLQSVGVPSARCLRSQGNPCHLNGHCPLQYFFWIRENQARSLGHHGNTASIPHGGNESGPIAPIVILGRAGRYPPRGCEHTIGSASSGHFIDSISDPKRGGHDFPKTQTERFSRW